MKQKSVALILVLLLFELAIALPVKPNSAAATSQDPLSWSSTTSLSDGTGTSLLGAFAYKSRVYQLGGIDTTTMFSDNFSYPDGPIPDSWIVAQGVNGLDVKIQNGKMIVGDTSAGVAVYSKDITDFDLSVDVRNPLGDFSTGIAFRYIDLNNFYQFFFNPISGDFRIRRHFQGSEVDIVSTHVPTGTSTHTIRITATTSTASGSTFVVYLDNIQQLQVSDSSLPFGKIGLIASQSTHSEYDNLTVQITRSPSRTDIRFASINPDGTLSNWSPTTPLPQPRSLPGEALLGNRVYVIGGNDGFFQTSDVWYATINGNGTLTSWTTVASLPHNLQGHQVVVVGNRIYVMGGYDGFSKQDAVYYTTINSNGSLSGWTTTTPLPEARTQGAAVAFGSRIYYIGGQGQGPSAPPSSTVFSALVNPDGTTGSWSTATALPQARWTHRAALVGDTIYVIGGCTDLFGCPLTSATSSIVKARILSDGLLTNWVSDTDIPEPKSDPGVAATDAIYVLGGGPANTSSVFFARAAGWELQTSPSNKSLFGVHFVDGQNGWAVGGDGVSAPVIHTFDGGISWNLQADFPQSSTFGGVLFGVDFVDSLNGWVVGASTSFCDVGGGGCFTIKRTSDGGNSWVNQESGLAHSTNDVDFVDVNNGWAIRSLAILRTTNGGSVWTCLFQCDLRSGAELRGVKFVNVNNGWVVGDSGTLFRTTNGGTNWNSQNMNVSADYRNKHFRSVDFVDVNNGWIAGSDGTILRTDNGGATWSNQSSGVTITLNSIKFVNVNLGLAVGDTGTTLFTNDGGNTWNSEVSGTMQNLHEVSFPDSENAWAVGDAGVILHRVSGGPGGGAQPDTAPPTVGSVSPTTATVNITTTFSASYADNVGVVSCNFLGDGIDRGSMTLSNPGGTGGTASKANVFTTIGTHTAQVKCKDAANNEGIGPITSINVVSNVTLNSVIRVVKNAIGGNGNFTFRGSGDNGLPMDFTITTIGGTGSVSFNVSSGSYGVSEIVPSGWNLTSSSCTTGTPSNFTVTQGENVTCSFNNTKPVSIGGIKFNDMDGNHVKDAGEPGLSGWAINLRNATTGVRITTTFTGANGSYSFVNISPGSYKICEAHNTKYPKQNWIQTFPTSGAVCTGAAEAPLGYQFTVTSGNVTDIDFGNFQRFNLTGEKLIYPSGPGGASGWTVNLRNGTNGALVASNITGADGSYSFANLGPGFYKVCEALQAGWYQVFPVFGDTCTGPGEALKGYNFTAISGFNQTGKDFANARFGVIKVVKSSLGGNGVFNFTTTGGDGLPASFNITTTGGTGNQTFVAVAGNYSVSEIIPAGWKLANSTCTSGVPSSFTLPPGGTVTCTFLDKKLGIIRIIKNSTSGDRSFSFATTGGGLPANFSITTVGGTGMQTYIDIDPDRVHGVSESVPSGWRLKTIACVDPSGDTTMNLTIATATIKLAPGETVACTFVDVKQLASLGPAKVWVGLRNSDDVGTFFDLKAEVYLGGTLVGSGQLNYTRGGSSGFNNARANLINLTLLYALGDPNLDVAQGSTFSIKVYVRNTCFGKTHNSGTARLWYNDAQADSNFGATIGNVTRSYYLLDGFTLGASPGVGPKKFIDIAGGSPCSPFKLFGEWSTVIT